MLKNCWRYITVKEAGEGRKCGRCKEATEAAEGSSIALVLKGYEQNQRPGIIKNKHKAPHTCLRMEIKSLG